jgi:mRNA interferase MazF
VTRGDFYRVRKPTADDPKRFRVFPVVSRQVLIDPKFSTVICARVYAARNGLPLRNPQGRMKACASESSVHCDEVISLQKQLLTSFGHLSTRRLPERDRAWRRSGASILTPESSTRPRSKNQETRSCASSPPRVEVPSRDPRLSRARRVVPQERHLVLRRSPTPT